MTVSTERESWLEWRRSGIGGSDVAALLGVSKWSSPSKVWADKLGLLEEEQSELFDFGHRAEPMLARWLGDVLMAEVADAQAQVVHGDHCHHRATLDGRCYPVPPLLIAENKPFALAEFKTTRDDPWSDHRPDMVGPGDAVPIAYQVQAQWQMHVDGASRVYLGALHGRRFRVYGIDRDDDAIAMAVAAVDAFWYGHVRPALLERDANGVAAAARYAPPVDGSDATRAALAAIYPRHIDGKTADLTEVADEIAALAEVKARQKADRAEAQRLEARIKAAIGDAETGLLNGEPVLTYRASDRAAYTVAATTVRALRTAAKRKAKK